MAAEMLKELVASFHLRRTERDMNSMLLLLPFSLL